MILSLILRRTGGVATKLSNPRHLASHETASARQDSVLVIGQEGRLAHLQLSDSDTMSWVLASKEMRGAFSWAFHQAHCQGIDACVITLE